MDNEQITAWLRENNRTELDKLWIRADSVRKENVGDDVYLRGLLEFSNVCSRRCIYCGISADVKDCRRYSMTEDEILQSAQFAADSGYGTVVLQSGENKKLNTQMLADVITKIKAKTSLAITLSVGEWPCDIYKLWKQAGADRFLLRFETSDDKLYSKLHPDCKIGVAERYEKLEMLRDLGYEVGSGVMIGVPSQSFESLADDIIKIRELNLHMIGTGPYVPHWKTRLTENLADFLLDTENQVPANEEMAYKVMALIRILCPKINLPATTALATLNFEQGYENGLKRGCNVVMPNITPVKYRKLYNLYFGKACKKADDFEIEIKQRIKNIGRTIGAGRGDSLKFTEEVAGKV
ncbi:MAG: [FeFe] hydrogenase H-cluster radical SAM maturase HydE [Anaerohalosphaeraceae bacterium]|nr:[FeFe] hydrogenase H-cluster radical SAM maturase HydE [Anaerohalosphaeraceae bacterium]